MNLNKFLNSAIPCCFGVYMRVRDFAKLSKTMLWNLGVSRQGRAGAKQSPGPRGISSALHLCPNHGPIFLT